MGCENVTLGNRLVHCRSGGSPIRSILATANVLLHPAKTSNSILEKRGILLASVKTGVLLASVKTGVLLARNAIMVNDSQPMRW